MIFKERYTYKLYKHHQFERLWSTLYTSTNALSNHLSNKHHITKDTDPASINKPTTIKQ